MRWIRRSRFRYALPGALALAVIVAAYLLTHPFPALGGGLFLKMGETIAANGYGLPERIPGYTTDGLPYGYPPLAAYLMATLLDAGADPLAIARWLPPALLFGTVPCYYLFAETVLDLRGTLPRTPTRVQAAGATVVFVTTPAVLQYTLTAGGTIRATALLVTCTGLAVGARLFGRREYRLTVPATVLFGVALLVHLKYALCFAVSYLYLYASLDRTERGLVRGAAVAVGGFAISAPWWFRVGTTHGFEIFTRAGGTHGGIGSTIWPIELLTPVANPPPLWPALIVVAGLLLLVRGEYFLPLWTAIVGFVVGNDEHAVLVGALMVTVLLREGIRRSAASRRPTGEETEVSLGGGTDGGAWIRADRTARGRLTAIRRRLTAIRTRLGGRPPTTEDASRPSAPARRARANDGGRGGGEGRGLTPAVVVIALLFCYGVGSAAAYAGSQDRLPMYVDGDDVEAADWVRSETPPDATFVVIGDTAEWFPLLADRTSLVAARGSEWHGAAPYARQRQLRSELSECLSAECVSGTLAGAGLSPGYVYLPRSGYVEQVHQMLAPLRWSLLRADFERSSRYEIVHRNEGVVVVRVVDPPWRVGSSGNGTASTNGTASENGTVNGSASAAIRAFGGDPASAAGPGPWRAYSR